MTTAHMPLLTIAIPTFTRAGYLELNLQRLVEEIRDLDAGMVEVLVSDNHSTDDTPGVVARAIAAGLPIRYIRNTVDIGSDANIAQCFNEAQGQYVQIMGDDDLYVRGMLKFLVSKLLEGEYGVVCLRSYGYENDYQAEFPGGHGEAKVYDDVGSFLFTIGPLITFISGCVFNRRVQQSVDARTFCGSNLVQVHLIVNAMLQVPRNMYLTDYILACKRNNSGGYDFSEVFVERLGNILDSFRSTGLSVQAIRRFETGMLMWYHPFYLFRQRLAKQGTLSATRARFVARFGRRPLYRFWVAPIIWLPRPLALAWGAMATLVGRAMRGDLRRGIVFAWNRLRLPKH